MTKLEIEYARYFKFRKDLASGAFKGLRVGQAFHQVFGLDKSTSNKEAFDHLYTLDGVEAFTEIDRLFEAR